MRRVGRAPSLSTGQPSWRHRRFDPDHSLGLRLTLAATAAFLVLVPFALLALLVLGAWPPLLRLDASVTDALHGYAADHPAWVRLMSGLDRRVRTRAAAGRRPASWWSGCCAAAPAGWPSGWSPRWSSAGCSARCSSCWSAGTGRTCSTRWPGPPATRSRPGTR